MHTTVVRPNRLPSRVFGRDPDEFAIIVARLNDWHREESARRRPCGKAVFSLLVAAAFASQALGQFQPPGNSSIDNPRAALEEIAHTLDQVPASIPPIVLRQIVRARVSKALEGEPDLLASAESDDLQQTVATLRQLRDVAAVAFDDFLAVDASTVTVPELATQFHAPISNPILDHLGEAEDRVLATCLAFLLRDRASAKQLRVLAGLTAFAEELKRDAPKLVNVEREMGKLRRVLRKGAVDRILASGSPQEQLQRMAYLAVAGQHALEGNPSDAVADLERLVSHLRPVSSQDVDEAVDSIDKLANAVDSVVTLHSEALPGFQKLQSKIEEQSDDLQNNVERAIKAIASDTERQRRNFENELASMTNLSSTKALSDARGRLERYTIVLNRNRHALALANSLLTGSVPVDQLLSSITHSSIPLPPEFTTISANLDNLADARRELTNLASGLLTSDANSLEGLLGSLPRRFGLDGLSAPISEISGTLNAIGSGSLFSSLGSLSGVGSILGAGFGGLQTAQIMKKLEQMDRKLDAVLDNQRRILEKLDEISAKLDVVREEMAANHRETTKRLDAIQRDLLINRALLIEILERPLLNCSLFAVKYGPKEQLRRLQFGAYQNELWKFESYEHLNAFWVQSRDYFRPCLSALHTQTSSTRLRFYNNPLSASSAQPLDPKLFLEQFVKQHFERFHEALAARAAPESTVPKDTTSLLPTVCGDDVADMRPLDLTLAVLYPSLTVTSLCEKLTGMPPRGGVVLDLERATPEWSRISADDMDHRLYLNSSAIVELIDFAVSVFPFQYVLDPTDGATLLTESQLYSLDSFVDSHRHYLLELERRTLPTLRSLLQLVNRAIAHQAVLSGDALLLSLNPTEVPEALQNNYVFMRNLVMVKLQARLRQGAMTAGSYSLGLRSERGELKELLGGVLDLHKRRGKNDQTCNYRTRGNQTWYARFGTVCISLPEPSELEIGRLEVTSELLQLRGARRRLVEYMAGSVFVDHLTKTGRRHLLSDMLVRSEVANVLRARMRQRVRSSAEVGRAE